MTTASSPTAVDVSLRQIAREDFHVFSMLAFAELSDTPYLDNWHIAAIARKLERVEEGDIRRAIICMPPRTMKSLMASVFFPAWLLGRAPSTRIICASYAQPLANDFASQMRTLMRTHWYRSVFPIVALDPKRSAVEDIWTSQGGYRLSTSTGGVLTGRGADVIIIDDPIKAADAFSDTMRESAISWYSNTVVSRLNNPKTGKIIVVAQRLHEEDLAGHLRQDSVWDELTLPLVEWEKREIEIVRGQSIVRLPGDILHAARFSEEEINSYRETMGQRDFDAQYNQRPLPPGGALFKLEWFNRYTIAPAREYLEAIFQSWDTAYDLEAHNDYSVCTTWGVVGKKYYLLDVYRERLIFPDLQKQVLAMRAKHKANLVIVEAVGSGKSLWQNLANNHTHWLKAIKPESSKQDRASKQTPKFERGEVYIPNAAPWLKAFEHELLAFPQSKFDDQVDSVTQFLAAVDTGNLMHNAQIAHVYFPLDEAG